MDGIYDQYGRFLTNEIDLANWFNATLVLFDFELEQTYEYIHWMEDSQ